MFHVEHLPRFNRTSLRKGECSTWNIPLMITRVSIAEVTGEGEIRQISGGDCPLNVPRGTFAQGI